MSGPLRVYLAEDEPLAQQALVAMFAELESWKVIGVAGDGAQALRDCSRDPPDLLLTDIKMPLVDGLELVAELREHSPRTHFAFITAHEQHAVRAFRLAAVDYLLKPVTTADFRVCLERVERALARPPERRFLECLLIRSVGRIDVVQLSEVIVLRATGNYVEVITRTETHLHRQTMKTLLEELDPAVFVQTHRSVIVAGRSIRALERLGVRAGAEVVLDTGMRLPISARFFDGVERFLREFRL